MNIKKITNNNDGSFQNSRMPEALSEEYIRIDERTLPDLLNAMRSHAENINFYDLDGTKSGNWLSLLLSNEAILLSAAIPININELKRLFLVKKSQGLRQAISETWRHIHWINHWMSYESIIKSQEGAILFVKVKEMLETSLISVAADIYNLAKVYDKQDIKDRYDIHNFNAVWDINNRIVSRETLKIYKTRQQKEERLSAIFNSIVNVLVFMSSESGKAFEVNIKKQVHHPASAMILAFLNAYRLSQNKTNQFTERMLEYYYTKIQRNRAITGKGDKVYLECKLNPVSDSVLIPGGTQFSAGKTQDLRDILYETLGDTLITGAKLVSLKTLFLQRHLLISPENLSQSVTRIKLSDVMDHLNKNSEVPHSLFGYDDGASGYSIGVDSDIGMAISSRLLKLKEGQRRIDLEFSVEDKHLESIVADNATKSIAISISEKIKIEDISSELTELALLFFKNFLKYLDPDENMEKLKNDLISVFNKKALDIFIKNNINKVLKLLYKCTIFELLIKAETEYSFSMIYKKFLCRYMFNVDELSKNKRDSIIEAAKRSLLANSKAGKHKQQDFLRVIKELNMSSQGVLFHYFSNAFLFKITSKTGWYEVSKYERRQRKKRPGFTLGFDINKDVPPIIDYDREIHGGKHQQGAPILSICINSAADIYPYSYIQPFSITGIKLNVKVKGYKNVTIHNDHGLVDRSKPFLPFGPMPAQGASCYIGGLEYAEKNITKISLNVSWKNLPINYGGMVAYYEEYDSNLNDDNFNVRISLSSKGGWYPHNEDQQQISRLFSQDNDTGILKKIKRFNINTRGQYPVLTEQLDESEFNDLNNIRNGYIKLSLSTAEIVFGHKIYPEIISEVLTRNSKNKKQVSLPVKPYTPEIDSLSVDYCAEEFINIDSSRLKTARCYNVNAGSVSHMSVSKPASVIYYLTPPGNEMLSEQAASRGIDFFPQWKNDGNIYIGFTMKKKEEYLNIYLQLKNDSTHSIEKMINPVCGTYYSETGWREISRDSIVYDSTARMMHTGIITLKIPADIFPHPVMEPVNSYWITLSGSQNLSHYSTIKSLGFDAISLRSLSDDTKLSKNGGISNSWKALKDINEINSYEQSQPAFSSQDGETVQQTRVRFHERLRHKNRAINVWDYERLVLEEFPQLYLVKCFPATSSRQLRPAPGQVLIVVVPEVPDGEEMYNTGHLVNTVVLQQIRDYLKPLMASGVKFEVRNPVYEDIQLRCGVKFTKSHNPGQLLKRLNRDISECLSPWSKTGYGVKFGWKIQAKDLESSLLDLDYVEDIIGLSLIDVFKVQDKPKKYTLTDSANNQLVKYPASDESRLPHQSGEYQTNKYRANKYQGDALVSALPWSLIMPVKQHHIEIINEETVNNRKPVPVGINSLRIGGTFIIQGTESIPERTKRDAISQ